MKPAGVTERSSALLPEKNDVSCTRSYAARGSSHSTVISKSCERSTSDSRNRCPTMPWPIITSCARALIAFLRATTKTPPVTRHIEGMRT
jgi:hypothetical protein